MMTGMRRIRIRSKIRIRIRISISISIRKVEVGLRVGLEIRVGL